MTTTTTTTTATAMTTTTTTTTKVLKRRQRKEFNFARLRSFLGVRETPLPHAHGAKQGLIATKGGSSSRACLTEIITTCSTLTLLELT